MKYKILIADDEPDIIELLEYNLKKEGFEVFTASNGKQAIDRALEVHPHLIILDVMMPEMDGMEACEKIRTMEPIKDCMITFLTARAEDYSQLAGFELGADDYITKPIKPKILISRIKALLKRASLPTVQKVKQPQSEIIIDRERYLIVMPTGKEIVLPRKEFELLSLLISKPGRVFTRENILASVWGDDVIVGDRTIDVHIRKLREKIGDKYIQTIKGVGYKYDNID